MEEIQSALEELKTLGKYAAAEVERIFELIKKKTLENYQKLYPYSNPTFAPSRLHLNKGRDRTVEAYLSGHAFELPGQAVANAGMLRAVALAFYFALLDRHPAGLGFIIMDDPILSLDDDHREAWAANVLRPSLSSTQVILATHQRQFLNNCGADFQPGRRVELNPRTRSKQVTYRPGDRLERAEELVTSDWISAPTMMRKYREELLITLDAYSPVPFFNPSNLRYSLDCYAGLAAPNPLAHPNQNKITQRLRDPKIERVLDPGSHAMTEADVTEPMVVECLRKLGELDKTLRNELERLESLRLRDLRRKVIGAPAEDSVRDGAGANTDATRSPHTKLRPIIPVEQLRVGDDDASWSSPIAIQLIGAAAAQTRGCVVTISEAPWQAEFPAGGAVLVAEDSLAPIARPGQWLLLADASVDVGDGDLAAVADRFGNHYVRRVWSVGDSWILEAVNPMASGQPIVVRKSDSAVRRIIGVLYAPQKPPNAGKGRRTVEWIPRKDFSSAHIAKFSGVAIDGTSLEPIASSGHVVLVDHKVDTRFDSVRNGCLAVVETDDERVGNVIKRVYPQTKQWMLRSVNLIDSHEPISIPTEEIRAVWLVRGVLFEAAELEPN